MTTAADFPAAFYIKLGRGGMWEKDSIETGKLRLGWSGQATADINAGNWDKIERQLREKDGGKKVGATTSDLNALRTLSGCAEGTMWITFYQSKLWWARLAPGLIEEDAISKFRRTAEPWRDEDVNGRLLAVNNLPGKISQLQGFRATVCRVRYPDLLARTLNGSRSDHATAISAQRAKLSELLTEAIKELHWKDFETLVDLVFRDAGSRLRAAARSRPTATRGVLRVWKVAEQKEKPTPSPARGAASLPWQSVPTGALPLPAEPTRVPLAASSPSGGRPEPIWHIVLGPPRAVADGKTILR